MLRKLGGHKPVSPPRKYTGGAELITEFEASSEFRSKPETPCSLLCAFTFKSFIFEAGFRQHLEKNEPDA